MMMFRRTRVFQQVMSFLAGMAAVALLSAVWRPQHQYGHNLVPKDIRHSSHLFNSFKDLVGQRSAPSLVKRNATRVRGEGSGSNDTRCVKRLHIFADMARLTWIPELSRLKALFMKSTSKWDYESEVQCMDEGYDCDLIVTMGVRLKMLRGKDAVLFGLIPTIWMKNNLLDELAKTKVSPGQTWIFYSTEPPFRVIHWTGNTKIEKLRYHILMTYNHEAEIRNPFAYYRPFAGPDSGPKDTRFQHDNFYNNRTGLVSWVATNCDAVFWPRMRFIEKLRELLPLDDYGKCGRKECLPRRAPHCNELFASYKFYLAIPNAECHDYITEKFWMISLLYGTVPLVLGAHVEDYERVAPPNSFVHFGNFESLEDAADHLKKVDASEELYRKYHEWRSKGEIVMTYPFHLTKLCRTIPHIRYRSSKDLKYIKDSPWYNGCRTIPSNATLSFETYSNFDTWSVWK